MVTTIAKYRCDTCMVLHNTPKLAEACEAVGLLDEINLEVGDFVEIPGKEYGWHNRPNSMWTRHLTDPEEIAATHQGAGRYRIIAIITDISHDKSGRDADDGHRPKYSVFCPEPPWYTGHRNSALHAWTRRPGHYNLIKVEPSPELAAWKETNFEAFLRGKASSVLL